MKMRGKGGMMPKGKGDMMAGPKKKKKGKKPAPGYKTIGEQMMGGGMMSKRGGMMGM